MDLLMAFLVFAGAMIAVLVWGAEYGMLLALGVGAAGFYLVARHRGFDSADLVRMMAKGMRRSLLVVRILVLVGAMTALWRAGGTIAFFVVQGTRLIPPGMFLLAAFLLTAVMAYALGTSFGVTGTMGVILVTLARSGGVPVAMTAGAVLSGAYFGDRTAPASSCANLVATVCGVPIYDHVRRCLRSAAVPMLLCTAAYAALSLGHPLAGGGGDLTGAMEGAYVLGFWAALPAILMLALPLFRVPVGLAMLFSCGAALCAGWLVQGLPPAELLRGAVMGYQAPQGLEGLLSGGGILSMAKVAGVVLLSGTFSGIFRGTGMLSAVQTRLEALAGRWGRYAALFVTALGSAMLFCNQTIAILMCQQLLGPVYQREGCTAGETALDLSDSAAVLVALCPWCVACAVPLEMLGVGLEALPWAGFLWLLPLCRLVGERVRLGRKKSPPVGKIC